MSDPKKPIVHNFSPKSVFLSHGDKADKDFIQNLGVNPALERVLTVAFAQWSADCPDGDPSVGRQIQGVNRFIRTLKGIGDPKMPAPQRVTDHLIPQTDSLNVEDVGT